MGTRGCGALPAIGSCGSCGSGGGSSVDGRSRGPATPLSLVPSALPTSSRLPSPRIAARSITAVSSRTLPGHG